MGLFKKKKVAIKETPKVQQPLSMEEIEKLLELPNKEKTNRLKTNSTNQNK